MIPDNEVSRPLMASAHIAKRAFQISKCSIPNGNFHGGAWLTTSKSQEAVWRGILICWSIHSPWMTKRFSGAILALWGMGQPLARNTLALSLDCMEIMCL